MLVARVARGLGPTLQWSRSMAAIQVRDLRKSYGMLEAVRGVDFDVE